MRRQDKYPTTPTFQYLNANPHNRITTDCVIRAIAVARSGAKTEKKAKNMWTLVLNDLVALSQKTGFVYDDTKCYAKYLEQVGFEKRPQPRFANGTKMTLREFIARHPKGTYVVNMPSHLTAVVDGKNYDIWDCSKSSRRVGNYWENV